MRTGRVGSAETGSRASTDPARDALRKIAFLRPAGDECALTRKDAIAFVTQMERIALDALGEGL